MTDSDVEAASGRLADELVRFARLGARAKGMLHVRDFGAEFSAGVAEGLTAALRGSFSYQPDNADGGPTDLFSDRVFDSDAEGDASLDGLALGGGLGWAMGDWNIGVDYAYRHLGVLPAVKAASPSNSALTRV